jgi:plasmid stabilization system protein ParE
MADLEWLRDFLLLTDPTAAIQTIELILDGVEVIEHHPLIGRQVKFDLPELVISRGRSGYLALYRYNEARERATILAIRHQRQAGY